MGAAAGRQRGRQLLTGRAVVRNWGGLSCSSATEQACVLRFSEVQAAGSSSCNPWCCRVRPCRPELPLPLPSQAARWTWRAMYGHLRLLVSPWLPAASLDHGRPGQPGTAGAQHAGHLPGFAPALPSYESGIPRPMTMLLGAAYVRQPGGGIARVGRSTPDDQRIRLAASSRRPWGRQIQRPAWAGGRSRFAEDRSHDGGRHLLVCALRPLNPCISALQVFGARAATGSGGHRRCAAASLPMQTRLLLGLGCRGQTFNTSPAPEASAHSANRKPGAPIKAAGLWAGSKPARRPGPAPRPADTAGPPRPLPSARARTAAPPAPLQRPLWPPRRLSRRCCPARTTRRASPWL